MTTTVPIEDDLLDPKKYDPSDPEQRAAKEDAQVHLPPGTEVSLIRGRFMRYKSIAGANPFSGRATFRETLKEHEAHRPVAKPVVRLEDDGNLNHQHVYIVQHPALRSQLSQPNLDQTGSAEKSIDELVFGRLNSPIDPTTLLKRNSESSPSLSLRSFRPPGHGRHEISKSASDPNVLQPKSLFVSRSGSPHKTRKASPFPIRTGSPSKQGLSTIEEDMAKNYKVAVRYDPDSEAKIVRSPLKKLFGEGGLLGRSTSAKDLRGSRHDKNGLIQWGGKVKSRVEDMVSGKPKLFTAHID